MLTLNDATAAHSRTRLELAAGAVLPHHSRSCVASAALVSDYSHVLAQGTWLAIAYRQQGGPRHRDAMPCITGPGKGWWYAMQQPGRLTELFGALKPAHPPLCTLNSRKSKDSMCLWSAGARHHQV